ncbi:MAG: hypothetical protein K6G68_02935 [Oscillospiraceae bacterium]|nr:hypothetical protein [Oscillospiraceae bacterium]
MKKLIAGIAAVVAMSAFASTASAVDWSAAGHADGDDPATGVIISTDENGVTWGQATAGELSKFRITWADVLENPDDLSKVYSGSWKITYHGLSKLTGTDCGWMGGGTWVSTGNSAQYSLSPNDWAEDGTAVWEDEQTVEDSFKWLLGPAEDVSNEIVFMDWSGQDITDQSITFTVSDFKIFDKEGNEIPQKAYGGSSAAAEEAPAEEAAAEEAPAEEAAAEEAPAEEAAPAETEAAPAPAAAEETTSTATGNTSAAAAVAVMAAAAVAAYVSKKK